MWNRLKELFQSESGLKGMDNNYARGYMVAKTYYIHMMTSLEQQTLEELKTDDPT